MRIEISVYEYDHPAAIRASAAALTAFADVIEANPPLVPVPSPTPDPAAQPGDELPPTPTGPEATTSKPEAEHSEDSPPPPKRQRRAAEPTAEAKPQEAQPTPPPPETGSGEPPSVDDCRAALKRVADAIDLPAGTKVLALFNVKSVSALEPKDRAGFIAHCDDLVATKSNGEG